MPESDGVRVVTSLYALSDFAGHVGGGLVSVTNITPAGTEPHDYEPTPQDIARVYSADLFIFNGNGMDPWADKILPDLEAQGIVVLRMSDHVRSLEAGPEGNGERDPHFWLDPGIAQKEVGIIADALTKIDEGHAKEYIQNRDSFIAALAQLDREYEAGLSSCLLHEIFTSHNAFAYLAARYNLGVRYIQGLSPDEEPSARRIAELADRARAENVRYIFFETLVSPRVANTLAGEIGAQTLVLNPIEGLTDAELRDGKDYISIMRNNLVALRTALSCQ